MEPFWEFLKKYRALLIGAGTGLLIGILFLTIGFFPTILLAILGGIGALLGALPSLRSGIWNGIVSICTKLFGKKGGKG